LPNLKFVEASGLEHIIDAPCGTSVMQTALNHHIAGIVADCGGAMSCATCHVYVDPAWTDKMPPKLDMEETMLDFAQELEPTSRLSCQIKVTPELDGLVVRMPKSQH
jgi:ferredoxin, 2Fe-2S